MKKVIWKQTKQKMDYSLGEVRRKSDLAFKKAFSLSNNYKSNSCISFLKDGIISQNLNYIVKYFRGST